MRWSVRSLIIGVAAACASCSLFVDVDGLDTAQNTGDAAVDASSSDGAGADGGSQESGVDGGMGSSAYRAVVLSDSPVAYWRLGEDGGATAVDQTGANPGIYGITAIYGQAGAIANDPDTAIGCAGGVSPEVSIPSSTLDFAAKAPISIEAWMMPNIIDSSSRYLVFKEDNSPRNGYGVFVGLTGSSAPKVSFERILNGAFDDLDVSPVALNVFSHVVFTFDGTNVTGYLNGVQAIQNTFMNSLVATSSSLTIGGGGQFPAGFSGTLDEIAIYDHALSAERVAAHFNVGKGL